VVSTSPDRRGHTGSHAAARSLTQPPTASRSAAQPHAASRSPAQLRAAPRSAQRARRISRLVIGPAREGDRQRPFALAPHLIKPPTVRRLPNVVTVADAGQLFAATRVLSYRVLYFTLYSLGLRLGEGLRLQVGDIDAARQRVHIRNAKGNKDRLVPLPAVTLATLRRFWQLHRHPLLLFPCRQGGVRAGSCIAELPGRRRPGARPRTRTGMSTAGTPRARPARAAPRRRPPAASPLLAAESPSSLHAHDRRRNWRS